MVDWNPFHAAEQLRADAAAGLHNVYDSTVGHAGQSFNDKIVAPIGDSANAALGAPAFFIRGAEQNATDLAGGVKIFFGGLGEKIGQTGYVLQRDITPIPRDFSVPAGQGIRDVTIGLGNLGSGAGAGLGNAGKGLADLGKYAGLGIGILAVLVVLAIVAYFFRKGPTRSGRAAGSGASA